MNRFASAFAISALAFAASAASAQDLTITYRMGDGQTASHYFTKDRVRMSTGRTDTIVDLASGRIVSLDNEKKQYFEMTIDEIEAAMKGASAQMEQAMAQVPPAMRAQMEKMMGGAAAEVTLTKGGTKTIAGYSCQLYTITMGQNVSQESCHTTAITPPFDPGAFKKLSRASMPMMQGADKFVAKLSEIQGLSLMENTTMSMMGRKNVVSMEATEVKKGPVPASVFDMPAGYKKVESPLKQMGRMGGR